MCQSMSERGGSVSPEEEIVRGNQARAILQDKMYAESWAVVEQQLVSLLKQVDIDPAKVNAVMRPSATFNAALAAVQG